MHITFLGATETVTGSKYLIEHERTRILVDCGLFQGHKELRLRNWEKLPIRPSSIDAVILTHAHIDHSGYLPLLVKEGFSGPIFASAATFDLCSLLLPDAGKLQEEDAARANRYSYSKHRPALPLFTVEDAKRALKQFRPVGFGTPYDIADGLHFTFSRSGHILGSAFITLSDGDKTVIFSGDLGRPHDPVMKAPAELQHADYILIESTYGDRIHDPASPEEALGAVIRSTAEKGGTVLIPAFAVGRAQSILYYLYKLKDHGQIPNLPIFLDSPMAIDATRLLMQHWSEHRLSETLCRKVCATARYVKTVEESKQLAYLSSPAIIISASGMATGGRVLHHLKHILPNPKHTVLFAGFQAGGTRGDRLMKGEKSIKIHGEMISVRARIENVDTMSAHADSEEILAWLRHFRKAPQKIFITHGEPEAAAAIQSKIQDELGWNAVVPRYLDKEEL